MKDVSRINLAPFDRPEVLSNLFWPRQDDSASQVPGAIDLVIPVDNGERVGGRLYVKDRAAPSILFFHGNGEVVADYDDIAQLYLEAGLNFLPVDYRGYGRSSGCPTVTGMLRDCHYCFDFFSRYCSENGFTGKRFVMGRSLGSASALELADACRDDIAGIIIDSGFAYALPLLDLMGIDTAALGLTEEAGMRNIDKMQRFDKPTLIIHAQYDQIIPYSDAKALYEACPAKDKRLLMIPGADHNTIFFHGTGEYMYAVMQLCLQPQ